MQKDVVPDATELAAMAEQLGMGDPWRKGPHTSLPAASHVQAEKSSRSPTSVDLFPCGLRAMRSQPPPKEEPTTAQTQSCPEPSMSISLRHRKPGPPPPPTDNA